MTAATQSPALGAAAVALVGVVDADRHVLGDGLGVTRGRRAGLVHHAVDPAAVQRALEAAGRAAAAGDDTDLDELATLARTHDDLLRALVLGGPVLPVRFGALLRDAAAVHELVQRHDDALGDELDRMRDLREWRLRVVRAASARTERAATGSGDGPTGTDYLLGRRDALRRVELDRARVDATLRALDADLTARAAVALDGRRGPMEAMLSRAYLVAVDREADVTAAVEAADRTLAAAGVEARLSGPLPPWSFVDVRFGGGS